MVKNIWHLNITFIIIMQLFFYKRLKWVSCFKLTFTKTSFFSFLYFFQVAIENTIDHKNLDKDISFFGTPVWYGTLLWFADLFDSSHWLPPPLVAPRMSKDFRPWMFTVCKIKYRENVVFRETQRSERVEDVIRVKVYETTQHR